MNKSLETRRGEATAAWAAYCAIRRELAGLVRAQRDSDYETAIRRASVKAYEKSLKADAEVRRG